VNDTLAKKLGLQDISVIDPKGTDAQGRPWGLLRMGTLEAQPLSAFLASVKNKLGCQGLKYVDAGKPVSRVAVGGGACAGELQKAYTAGCDTFVTSDIRYNQFWDAKNLGINLIDAGHFHTENPACRYLAQKLRDAFPEVAGSLATSHHD
jgi:putative NIF3 family GTP cyclohydrolase 1 type 2